MRAHFQPSPIQRLGASRLHGSSWGALALKLETCLPTRAFKVRGALASLLGLPASERARPVVTASAGNHGLGVAYAARRLGIGAEVVVPEAAVAAKVAEIELLGARVERFGATVDEALEHAAVRAGAQGARFVHPFDDAAVIAGQGTLALELLDQVPDLGAVVVPVGGGGLLAGVAAVVKGLRPGVRLVGVEPRGADAMTRSLAADRRVELEELDTIADGLATRRVGELTFALARDCCDEMVRVGDDEIREAMRILALDHGVVAEPAGATAVAGLVHDGHLGQGYTVALVTGANADASMLGNVLLRDRHDRPASRAGRRQAEADVRCRPRT